MAQAVISTLGSWQRDNTTVDDVDQALSGLRRHEPRAAIRTAVLTLVCVVPAQSPADQALQTLSDLGARHPARTVLVVTEDDDAHPPGIDARASVNVVDIAGGAVCYEEVVLRVRGAARHHLDAVIRPLSLPDLPVVIWTPVQIPAPGDPILGVGDRMLVDSRAVAQPERAIREIANLIRKLPVADLSWVRLAPWRHQLAGLFQGAVNRPFLTAVDQVEVTGNFAPRHLLAGWVSRRLDLAPEHVTLGEAPHLSIRLTATCNGERGEFAVSRPADERVLVTRADIDNGPSWAQTSLLRDRRPARALAEAFTTADSDRSYRDALAGALRLLRRAEGGTGRT